MALGALPYKYKPKTKTTLPGNPTGREVTFDILDANNVVMASGTSDFDTSEPPVDFFNAARDAVITQMATDAGGMDNLLTALINKPVTIGQ